MEQNTVRDCSHEKRFLSETAHMEHNPARDHFKLSETTHMDQNPVRDRRNEKKKKHSQRPLV